MTETIGVIKACNIAKKEDCNIIEFMISNSEEITMDDLDYAYVMLVIGAYTIMEVIRGFRK